MTDLIWVISSSVLILAVIAIRAAFGKRMSAGLKYALWGLVLLRLLIPGTVASSPLSVESAARKTEVVQNLEAVREVSAISRTETGFVVGQLKRPAASQQSKPALQTLAPAATAKPAEAAKHTETAVSSSAEKPESSVKTAVILSNATPERFERMQKTLETRDILNIIWYTGMALCALYFIAANLRFFLRLRSRRERLDTEAGCPVYQVEGLTSSCLFLNSIYISKETAKDEAKLRCVLAHERAHRRHGDGAIALLRSAAIVLHWYNPLVWIAAFLSRRDSEVFADAGAIASIGEEEREQYGRTLIELSAGASVYAPIACAATMMTSGKSELKTRISNIAKRRRMGFAIAAIVLALALAAVGCSFLGGDNKKDDSEAASPTAAPTAAPTAVPEATEELTEAPTAAPTDAPEPTEEPEPTEIPMGTPMPENIFEDISEGGAKVYAGKDVFFIYYPDGSLYGWGNNEFGQLGTGDTENRTEPVLIANGLEPVIVGETVFALSSDNILWGWGRNDRGELGLGDTENRSRPVEIMPFVKEVISAVGHIYSVTEAGEVYEWGWTHWFDSASAEEKELMSSPRLMFENVEFFNGYCVVKDGGELWRNLGEWEHIADGVSMVCDRSGFIVKGTDGKLYHVIDDGDKVLICDSFRSVAQSEGMIYILMEDGSLYSYQNVRINPDAPDDPASYEYRLTYVMNEVAEFTSEYYMDEDWGYEYNFALKANGELWSWSFLDNSVVGKPEGLITYEPECVATDVRKIVSNGASTYIIKANGEVWATGMNSDDFINGALGDGTTETKYGFVKLDIENAVSVTSGFFMEFIYYDDGTDGVELYSRTFAVDKDGRLFAWGYNGDGLLGVESSDKDVLSPKEIKFSTDN